MRQIATWIARGAFAGLVTVSSYAAVLSQGQPLQGVRQQQSPVVVNPERENEILHDRVVSLGDRLSNIEGKLDVMEKLDIGLIIAMGGQLLHLALASKKRGGQ